MAQDLVQGAEKLVSLAKQFLAILTRNKDPCTKQKELIEKADGAVQMAEDSSYLLALEAFCSVLHVKLDDMDAEQVARYKKLVSECMTTARQALTACQGSGLKKGEMFSLHAIGSLYVAQQETEKAIKMATIALPLAEELDEAETQALLNEVIANAHATKAIKGISAVILKDSKRADRMKDSSTKLYLKAIEALDLVQEIAKDNAFHQLMVRALIKASYFHLMAEQTDEAKEKAQFAVDACRKARDSEGEIQAVRQVLEVHLANDDMVAAVTMCRCMVDSAARRENKKKEGDAKFMMAFLLYERGDPEETIAIAKDAATCYKMKGDERMEAEAMELVYGAHLKQDPPDYQEAFQAVKKVVEIAEGTNDKLYFLKNKMNKAIIHVDLLVSQMSKLKEIKSDEEFDEDAWFSLNEDLQKPFDQFEEVITAYKDLKFAVLYDDAVQKMSFAYDRVRRLDPPDETVYIYEGGKMEKKDIYLTPEQLKEKARKAAEEAAAAAPEAPAVAA